MFPRQEIFKASASGTESHTGVPGSRAAQLHTHLAAVLQGVSRDAWLSTIHRTPLCASSCPGIFGHNDTGKQKRAAMTASLSALALPRQGMLKVEVNLYAFSSF